MGGLLLWESGSLDLGGGCWFFWDGESSRFLLCSMVVMIVSSLECDMINLYAITVCCFKCAFILACD